MTTIRILTLLIFTILSFRTYSQNTLPENKIKISSQKQDTIKKTIKDTFVITKKELENKNEIRVYIRDKEDKSNIFKDVLPILTLLLGIFLNRGFDYLTERKKIKKTGERWKAELSCLELPMKEQIEFLESFIIEHEKEKFEIPNLIILQSLDCENFNSLDKTELIKYFEKFKDKKYLESVNSSNKINSFIGILKNHFDNLKKKFEEYLNGTSNHTTNLSMNLQMLLKSFEEYGVQLESELGDDLTNSERYRPILALFNNEIEPYMKNGDFDVYKLEANFFRPLKEVLGTLRMDSKITSMTDYTRNCLNNIKGIKMEKNYLSENLTILIGRYKAGQDELKKVLDELK